MIDTGDMTLFGIVKGLPPLLARGRFLHTPAARRIPRSFLSTTTSSSEEKATTLQRDRTLKETFILADSELEKIWDKAHDKSTAQASPFNIENVVRLTISAQRAKLAEAIEAKEATKVELAEEENMGIFSSMLRWKRWGLSMARDEVGDELEAAKLLLEHLHATDDTVSTIMDSLGAEEGVIGDAVSKEQFLEAVRGGKLEQEELDVFIETLNSKPQKK